MISNDNKKNYGGHIVFKHKDIKGIKKKYFKNFLVVFFSIILGILGTLTVLNFNFNLFNISGVDENLKYDLNIANVVNKLNSSIVSVSAYLKEFDNSNNFKLIQNNMTGVLYSEDGYIVTNFYRLKDADRIYVKFPSTLDLVKEAKVIGYNEEYDVCVLKINGEGYRKAIFKLDMSDVCQGFKVISIGNTLGKFSSYSVYSGIVNNIDLSYGELDDNIKVINSSFNISLMNTGGPVCDINGEVLGINSFKFNFDYSPNIITSSFISSQDIVKLIDQIIESAT